MSPTTPQPAAPSGTNPCPPTPDDVPAAVDAAVESQSALRTVQKQWDQVDAATASYRHVVAEYEHKLAESLGDRARLREEMLAFGAYLRLRDVSPEHIVPCVHEAINEAVMAPYLLKAPELGQEIVRWAIEGYYGKD